MTAATTLQRKPKVTSIHSDLKTAAQPHAARTSPSTPWVIATDLDGAVADGPVTEKNKLYRALRRRGTCLLFYVTAKPCNQVRKLQQTLGLPAPDVTICDDGATIQSVRFEGRLTPLQLEIHSAIGFPGKALRALSYFVHAPLNAGKLRYTVSPRAGFRAVDVMPGVEHAVRDLGFSVHLNNANTIDLVPRGISKGDTLLRVLDWLDLHEDRVVIGGNKLLADRKLVNSGTPGFALANSPAPARRAADTSKHLYLADAPFSSGVLEGLQHFGVLRGKVI